MKRSELEKYINKKVEIEIFDGTVIKGELHKNRRRKVQRQS